jgi:hypothetical protein|uniref:Uncharacterized protein n=1 Tax=Agrobacterium albertimagni TaxID=147266 RepID=A0A7C1P199_9HYPH
MATFMMHSPGFVIIFRRLRQKSNIVNTGSEIPTPDENGFHISRRYWMRSEKSPSSSAAHFSFSAKGKAF